VSSYPAEWISSGTVRFAGNINFTGAQPGSTVPGQFNVETYGAVGNGVADDTTAIQNALNAAVAAGGGQVIVPQGTYNVTGLSVTLGPTTRLQVAGVGAAVLANKSTGAGSTAKCCLYVNGGSLNYSGNWFSIRDVQVQGSAAGGAGVYLEALAQGEVVNLYGTGFTSGSFNTPLYIAGCLDLRIVNPILTASGQSILGTGSGGVSSNAIQVYGGWLLNNTSHSPGYGCQILNGQAWSFFGTVFQGNFNYGYTDATATANSSFFGCWFENNSAGPMNIASTGANVNGCVFAESAALNIAATAHVVTFRNMYLPGNLAMTVALGATNVAVYDVAKSSLVVTDNSGGQFKQIDSYKITTA
jgi:hypothetical protein